MNKKALPLASLAISILLLFTLPALAYGDQVYGENDASALTGTWSGTNSLGNIVVTITADNCITISHPGCDLLDETGTFTAGPSAILITFDEGATQTYRYLLAGDILLLTDEEFLFPVRLTRPASEIV